MPQPPGYEPSIKGDGTVPKRILLAMAQERELRALLEVIPNQLIEHEEVASVGLYLIGPGDLCDTCYFQEPCQDRTRCMHQEVAGLNLLAGTAEEIETLRARFLRIPIGHRLIGHIGATGEEILIPDVHDKKYKLPDDSWIKREGVIGFVGEPLIDRDEIIGALGIGLRVPGTQDALEWVRIIAAHAAAAIVNARTFEEIDCLRTRLALENQYLQEEMEQVEPWGEMIGKSPALRNVQQQIKMVAPTEANVLVTGESGTGKELVAHEIHRLSSRGEGPLIRVNCAAVPRDLYESEFFGHVKGAFTGALRDRMGRFELANGGTLFLDEVGEIPIELQPKLLRVIQEGSFERVGGERTREVDVRLVAATNRDLKKEIRAGRFREDLFYRLSVFPVHVPPLRERSDDIPLLAEHFLHLSSLRIKKPAPRLTPADIIRLQAYPWPGNVRELQNVIERALITSRGTRLQFVLPEEPEGSQDESADRPPAPFVTYGELRRREKENLRAALEHAGGKVYGPGGAADLLGIRPTTLYSKVKRFGLKKAK